MSRLHLIKTKGVDNVELPKHMQTKDCVTVGDRLMSIAGADSPRMGHRNKTARKTARALGSRLVQTKSWKDRKQGEAGGDWKRNIAKGQREQAKKFRKGDGFK